ncbi:interactor protein for cytohesin exchange factors 1-like isoform X7 [Alosa sapidissima]|uniref:interactor protein for cytohesin exchange factors 1-like isoform X7 n=1 Tax=Alosa sapidissima TaxID=34773 RepID=UPI001C095D96|nr:interactor protein for cytohesin exchange factors 1-like isoform X7 [Alosa sapidissima]
MFSRLLSELASFPLSVAPPMAADEYNPVSLRPKSKKKTRGSNVTMSRRRVSVKELGPADHQGWLYRKKEGKGFLGIKWKKYWFVLKKTSLYWYTSETAEKAEGYINLKDFMIDRAVECKKKYAIKACHPQVMMFYFAAESLEDMNRWLNKLGLASIQYEYEPSEPTQPAECYSEASDHEETESPEAPPPPYTEQVIQKSLHIDGQHDGEPQGTLPPPYSSPPPSEATGTLSSPVSTMTSHSSASSLAKHRQSWLDLVSQSAPPARDTVVCSVQVHAQSPPLKELSMPCEDPASSDDYTACADNAEALMRPEQLSEPAESSQTNGLEDVADEMERLYIDLKRASLSPTGERKPSTKREFRASFIKRCKNHAVNEKLHVVRTLNSTLKAKEADLLTLDQVLSDPSLSASKFREWKESNTVLLQEICMRHNLQEEIPEPPVAETGAEAAAEVVTIAGTYAETSI